ncbi:gamma-glutamylcyclotransferase family protein [Halopiger goleimassiliensis]|uniref:gamma-glutamylcyclotransferase family protein n=1 Tax=Halopiger goleimassiliensis TaxID=1293048 RepID=UPI0006776C86|nr:gamma-glutamylcyclotransferase family protein [Halopiger goleimassiliensis]
MVDRSRSDRALEFVFVYGTLTDRAQVEQLLAADGFAFDGAATLEGLHRVDGRYPTLAPGGSVEGRVLAVERLALERLDAYEGVEDGRYVRTRVPIAASGAGHDDPEPGRRDEAHAHVYVGDPAELGVAERIDWPACEPFPAGVRQYLASTDVVVRPHE